MLKTPQSLIIRNS